MNAKQSNAIVPSIVKQAIQVNKKPFPWLFAFEIMANAATRIISPKQREIPEIEGYPSIQKEIKFLQKELGRSLV